MAVLMTSGGVIPTLGKLASDYSVGESVYLTENGTNVEYLVVHQGLPSSLYDSSCDGTWLLRKDLYVTRAFDSSDNEYANSDIHTYLNGTFLGLFNTNVKNIISQVKIPYTNSGSVVSGSNGMSTKIFLLSAYEAGYESSSNVPADGASLEYFKSNNNTLRIANYNGTATRWWLRSPQTSNTTYAWGVATTGSRTNISVTATNVGVRPVLILSPDARFDEETNVIK